jgi:hypothetical protein
MLGKLCCWLSGLNVELNLLIDSDENLNDGQKTG